MYKSVHVGREAAVLLARHALVLVDPVTGQLVSRIEGRALHRSLESVDIDVDGQVIAGTVGGYVEFYDPREGHRTAEMRVGGELVESVRAGDGFCVSGSSDKQLTVISLREHTVLARAELHRKQIYGVSLSPDGAFVATVSEDGGVATSEILWTACEFE
jgi:WD40 repeat protein